MIVRGDALRPPLRPGSVNLVVTSPPYWSLRSYRDGEEHVAGQLGDESEPHGFLINLWRMMDALWEITAPDASVFINLGDKSAGSGGHNNSGIVGASSIFAVNNRAVVDARNQAVSRRDSPDRYLQSSYVRHKSLHLLPHAFALGCIAPELYRDPFDPPEVIEDWANMRIVRLSHPQWICRAEIIWEKPNGMPESAADRVRRSHEVWFHMVKQRRYYYATDEIAEPYAESSLDRTRFAANTMGASRATMDEYGRDSFAGEWEPSPLGKIPGSVWKVSTAPLVIPDEVRAHYDLPKHHAPFPIEWPRKLILGWSAPGICTECGVGRHRRRARVCEECGELRPHQVKACPSCGHVRDWKENRRVSEELNANDWSTAGHGTPRVPGRHKNESVMTELVCDCPEPTAPTRPAVVLDNFGGSGTTSMVARTLGRIGVNMDLSADYCRLASWRIYHSGHGSKVNERTNAERQGELFG